MYTLGRLEVAGATFCNLSCISCNHHAPFFKKGKELTGADYVPWIKILREQRDVHIHTLCFTGGEPFLNKGLASLVREVKEAAGADEMEIFSNCFWLRDEASIDKYDDVLSQMDRFNYSLYQPVVDKIGLDEINRLIGLIKSRYPALEVSSFVDGVVKSFGAVFFYEEPIERVENHCPLKDCTQLVASKGILYRCTQGLAIESNHPGVSEGFRSSTGIVYDILNDTRTVEEWASVFPFDACSYCSCGATGREVWTPHVHDPAIRGMDKEQYKDRLVRLLFEGR